MGRVECDIHEERFKLFYKCWEDFKDLWNEADAIAVMVPPHGAGRWNDSIAMSFWLLGVRSSEALMVFTQHSLHFLSRGKPFSMTLKNNRDMDVVMHRYIRKREEDGGPQMFDIVEALRSEVGSRAPKVAVLLHEPLVGNVMRRWDDVLRSSQLEIVDAEAGFEELFAVKTEEELMNVEDAAMVSMATMANVMAEVQRAVEEQRHVTHVVLMRKAEVAILDAHQTLKLEEGMTSICNPPSLNSSGASGPDELLRYDVETVITCSLGARYQQYCSNLDRTYFVDPNRFQERTYNVLVEAHEAAIDALEPGNRVSAAYRAAADVLIQEDMNIPMTNCGSGMGLHFKERGLVLDMHNDKVVKPGMVFNVQLCYDVVSTTGNFSIALADTVIVGQEGPEVVTAECSKDFRDVSFSLAEVLDECEPPPKRPRMQLEAGLDNIQ